MIKQTNYWPDWQNNRINYIISLYGTEFFKGKRILELGSYNGYIGAFFQTLGADVFSLEGRLENVKNIQKDYPSIKCEVANLDTPNWDYGKWDIIINFGLFYHLHKFHKEHLENCIINSDLMFFETVVYDSFSNEIFYRNENGKDQSLSNVGGNPTTSFIESIFDNHNLEYTKITDSKLNGGPHKYDWIDSNSKKLDIHTRRFWIVNSKK